MDPKSKCAFVIEEGEFKENLNLIGHDFSKVDAHARATPKSECDSVEKLSKHLTSCWEDHLDKLRSIYVWITEHIEFDTDTGNLKDCSAEETLKTRKGGFSELFNELAKQAGVKAWKIKGKTRSDPDDSIDCKESDHTWNGTIYKGEYLLIDCAWGAGRLNEKSKFEKHFEPFYFLTPPTHFIYSHFPNDPKEQYLKPEVTKEEFLCLTHLKPSFFAAGLDIRDIAGNVITTHDDLISFEILRSQPDEGKPLHAVLHWDKKEHEVLIQRKVGYDAASGKAFKLQTTCPGSGEGKLEIYVLFEGNKGPLAASFKVVNKGDGKNHCQFVKTFKVPFGFTIHEPTQINLKCDKDYKFGFSVFDLKEEEHPEFSLLSPEKKLVKLHKASRCDDGSITYELETKLVQKGEWKLGCLKDGNHFDLIAQYHVE
ncbi:cytokinesis protein cyk3 [Gigaspora margarita]|uniref:Cytokinesis protein cyk3 n=1 Tax=Gigaspora margarita TaxID=4874 RepID=A0A8H3XD13_GIGMA|nr:cytokinesis protein cyk3 [Gigaspora margarita]